MGKQQNQEPTALPPLDREPLDREPLDCEPLDREPLVRDWDSTTLLSPGLDADVAAIARWAVALEAQEEGSAASPTTEDQDDDTLLSSSDTSSSTPPQQLVPVQRKRGHGDDDAPRPRPRRIRKPRKSTYTVQKEEKNYLGDEIRLLEARLELLRMRSGVSTPASARQRSLAGIQAANFELQEAIHNNLLGIGTVHSMLSRYMHTLTVGPLQTFIHLPRDRDERRATLHAMRDVKLRRARELLENRMQYIDNTKPYVTEERFITDDGVYHCKRFELLPFDGVVDATPVFDALLLYLANMGPTLRRKPLLGDPTIREDMELVEPATWHRRIVAPIGPVPYEVELHTVGFARLYAGGPDSASASPYGIVAADSVDVDELYPYKPSERVRKDVTAAISVRVEAARGDPTKRLVVVRRNTFLAIHPTPFALPEAVEEGMRAHIADWCRAMNASLKETMAAGRSI